MTKAGNSQRADNQFLGKLKELNWRGEPTQIFELSLLSAKGLS